MPDPARHPRSSARTAPRRPPMRASRSAAVPQEFESPWVRLRSATMHPFVYQRMIGDVDRAARPGDVVQVYDKTDALIGRGLFNPRSQITVRMLSWDDRPLDDSFWRDRIGQAIEWRRQLRLDETTDAYRLVHAEGDGLSGLIVERFADYLVLEIFSLGMHQRAAQLAGIVGELLGPPASLDRPARAAAQWQVFVRADEHVEEIEGFTVEAARAPAPSRLVVREHGLRYRVDVAGGHKTGFFCDQRENRAAFAQLCRDANVLDVCCYSGGFGIAAKVLGGARSVTGVDLDEAALAMARDNANLNAARIDLAHADAFVYLRQMAANERRFDAVVLDPPKFVAGRPQIEEGLRKYYDLNKLGAALVRPGGVLLTCSCSGLVSGEALGDAVHRAIRAQRRPYQIFRQTGAAPDHPVAGNCPESAYLKALWLRIW